MQRYCGCLQGDALNSWVFETSGLSLCFCGILRSPRWTGWFFFLNTTLIHMKEENSETHTVNVWDFLHFLLSFYYFCLMISLWTILMNSQCVAPGRAFKGKGKVITHFGQIGTRLINQFSSLIRWFFWDFQNLLQTDGCFDSSENALIQKLQLFILTLCLTHHMDMMGFTTDGYLLILQLAFVILVVAVLKCPTHAVSHISKALSVFLLLIFYWWNIISTGEGGVVLQFVQRTLFWDLYNLFWRWAYFWEISWSWKKEHQCCSVHFLTGKEVSCFGWLCFWRKNFSLNFLGLFENLENGH